MIDISPIQKYIREISPTQIGIIEHNVQRIGREEVFNNQLKYLDCTRISKDGMRLQQTIGYPYMYEMTKIVYIVQAYFSDDEDNKLQQILNLHQKNLEYEIEHPPVWYGGEKNKKKFEKDFNNKSKNLVNSRQKRVKFDENGEPIKSAAERKLALKVGKINALKFNIKPV